MRSWRPASRARTTCSWAARDLVSVDGAQREGEVSPVAAWGSVTQPRRSTSSAASSAISRPSVTRPLSHRRQAQVREGVDLGTSMSLSRVRVTASRSEISAAVTAPAPQPAGPEVVQRDDAIGGRGRVVGAAVRQGVQRVSADVRL